MKQIDKDVLVAEIERRIKSLHQVNSPREQAVLYECEDIISFIDSLEEKDVNLEEEIKSSMNNLCELGCYAQSLLDNPEDYEGFAKPFPKEVNDEIAKFAKHFFDLGLKAQKGEKYDKRR